MKASKQLVTLNVNGLQHQLTVDPDAPLLYILRNDLGLDMQLAAAWPSPSTRTGRAMSPWRSI